MKIKRKIVIFVATLILSLFVMSNDASASIADDMKSQVESCYENAKKAAEVTTFSNKLCTKATARQMEQVGIISYANVNVDYPVRNGNQWYSFYEEKMDKKLVQDIL